MRRKGQPADDTRVQRRRINDLHKLDVYRCALQLYRQLSRIVAQFPRGEADLRDQMKRAARSVPFNIGEGVGKRGNARAAAYQVALGEDKELIVALDCVEIDGLALRARAEGERVDRRRHEPAVEPKGATFTELRVGRDHDGEWLAQCIVDV